MSIYTLIQRPSRELISCDFDPHGSSARSAIDGEVDQALPNDLPNSPTLEGMARANHRQYLNEKIHNSRLEDFTVPGTGLQPPVNPRFAYGFVHGPILLEITHVTEIGISALRLEAVRQERELIRHQAGLVVPALPRFPRRCLKIFFTDGFTELEAIELEPLPNFALGETPMGRKVFVSDFPIIAGVAYLHPRNVAIVGGSNTDREAEHSMRLVRELQNRVREELDDRAVLDHAWRQIRALFSILSIPILWIFERMALFF
ncbi:hypothetical protein NMY22_g11054 [Coprinellus aureogranulatus]|nr:hypothetical protein NMY22_g11054 [Coprinellus aureogranulatus]